jgi:hypothetical protein
VDLAESNRSSRGSSGGLGRQPVIRVLFSRFMRLVSELDQSLLLNLRGDDAYGLIAQLRGLDVKVIMMSGSIEFPSPLEGIIMLEKPFTETPLVECLRLLK